MSSLSNIITEVGTFKDSRLNKYGEIYFRGQRSKHFLRPSLLRGKKREREIAFYEDHYYCDGWIMGADEFNRETSSWEILARFQHYNIPTRLMDWSSSLISAIYFALEKCLNCKNNINCKLQKTCEGNPVIWVLDPVRMHKELLTKDLSDRYAAFTIGVDDIQEYKDVFITETEKWKYGDVPIFLEIPWKNIRISKQKGYFTFHPNDIVLDSFLNSDKWLKKIEVCNKDIEDLVKEINIIGVNDHDMYSDLASLGRYLNRKK